MNRQSRNNIERNQCSQVNIKNSLKSQRNELSGNHRKQLHNRLSKSSTSLTSNSKKQSTTPSNNGNNNSKNILSNIKPSSAINLTSCEPKQEYECKIPNKKVYCLRDIQRKDFQFEFPRRNIHFDKGNMIKTVSKSSTNLDESQENELKPEENQNVNSIDDDITTRVNFFKKASGENIKNVTEKIKFLEEEVFNETDFDKKKKIVINFLKQIREDKKRRNEEAIGNGEPFIKQRIDRMIKLTPELMQSLNLQKSDISLLFKILQQKQQKNDEESSTPIKFSTQPFIKVNTNKQCTVKKKNCDISTKLNTHNTNVINESDCFMSKLQGHFIDRSLYQKERKPVVATPTLSTIIEEPESLHST